MKKILYYSEQNKDSNHTSVEGIFNKYLKKYFYITIVYKSNLTQKLKNSHVSINEKRKKYFSEELNKIINIQSYNFIIIRNDFVILENITKYKEKNKLSFLIGFQPSFPHSFRRLHEALLEKKSILRKTIEYINNMKKEEKLLKKIDFLLPISKMMNKRVNNNNIPYFNMYLGVDFTQIPKKINNTDSNIKFIYIGTIDKLREIDTIINAFDSLKQSNWQLDIYTKNYDLAKKYKLNMKNNSFLVNVYKSIPREKIYNVISNYDVGLSLIPVNDLYVVSSPIKLSEYFACKLTVITTAIPEAVDLYSNKDAAFFTNFDITSINKIISTILNHNKKKLITMGQNGYDVVKNKRNYEIISTNLSIFLNQMVSNNEN